ncbi:MAG: cation transporter [Alphaproteobacteria bacterium]|nr:cation transporter [Alphaproteobacteria bacterium]MBU1561215.1 cation transporter [Alphaproteobacteria bacterium]MBU2302877.1 cation transporter [Alphaproteobacteria bacterium]MBU2370311.1 cation transporter [Alphaproteobacteria bacterium]
MGKQERRGQLPRRRLRIRYGRQGQFRGMTSSKLTFTIGGMGCPDCVAAIENAVMSLPGVLYVGVSLAGATLTVRPRPSSSRRTWSPGSRP